MRTVVRARKRVYVSHVAAVHRSAWKAPLHRVGVLRSTIGWSTRVLRVSPYSRIYIPLLRGNTTKSTTVTGGSIFHGEGHTACLFSHAERGDPSSSIAMIFHKVNSSTASFSIWQISERSSFVGKSATSRKRWANNSLLLFRNARGVSLERLHTRYRKERNSTCLRSIYKVSCHCTLGGETGSTSFSNVPNRERVLPTKTFKTGLFRQVTRTFRVDGRGEVRWVEERNTTR